MEPLRARDETARVARAAERGDGHASPDRGGGVVRSVARGALGPVLTRARPAAIVLRDLIVTYGRVPAVHHVSGVFAPGSLTAVTGPNGGGKSTLMKTIAGLLTPLEGSVDRNGASPRDYAYLPQAAEIDRGFPLTVRDLVWMGDIRRSGLFGQVSAASRDRAEAALADVGLTGWEQAGIGELSVGQFRRALFARVIVQDASVVLLDEPFAGVDESTTARLVALVERWHAEGRTVVAVLHDHVQIEAHFPQTVILARECLGWGPTADVLTQANAERARAIIDRWQQMAEAALRHHHAHRAHAH